LFVVEQPARRRRQLGMTVDPTKPGDDPPRTDAEPRARIFISYSRQDLSFANRLAGDLQARGFEPRIDRDDIYAFEDWWKRIQALIVEADTIVFVLSPGSVASDVCHKEVAFAASLNKRFAPVVCRPVDAALAPQELARLNFIFFDDETQFDKSAAALAEALATDIEWVRRHTEFGERAHTWSQAGRPRRGGMLLRPPVLETAERWIASRPRGAPLPTEATQAFITESRSATTRQRNSVIASLSIGVIVTAILAALFYWQRGVADEQRKAATSRELAANSTSELSLDPELSVLLAREAFRFAPTEQAEQALRRALIESRVRLILRGHTDKVTDAVYSPDGKLVLSTSEDGTARVWASGSGQALHVLGGHAGPVANAIFSPDGRAISTASADGALRSWDVNSGDSAPGASPVTESPPIAKLKDGKEEIRFARFSPDRHVILTVSGAPNTRNQDHVVTLWNATTYRKSATMRGHVEAILDARFRPDGQYVLTASADRTARIWDAKTGNVVRDLNGHTDAVNTARFSRDGRYIVTASRDNTARVWDAVTGRVLAVLRGHEDWIGRRRGINKRRGLNSAEFSPDNREVVTTSGDGTARIWDAGTGLADVEMRGRDEPLASATFHPDGATVLTRSGSENAAQERNERPRAATPSVWDASTGVLRFELGGHEDRVTTALFRPDGRWIATVGEDRTVKLWNAEDGSAAGQLPQQADAVRDAAFSPDSSRIAVSSGDSLSVYDLRTHDLVNTLKSGVRVPIHLAFSPDGTLLLASSGPDKLARIWDVASGRIVHTVQHDQWVARAAFAPDGHTFTTASRDSTAVLWDTRTGKRRFTFNHADWVNRLVFNHQGDLLLTASRDDSARIWSVADGTLQVELGGAHVQGLLGIAFSPDGKFVATASGDNTARIWSVATGELLVQFNGAGDRVMSVMFSPEGKRVVAASEDGVARIYRCDVCGSGKDLDAIAARRVTRPLTPEERRRFLHESH